MYNKKYDFYPIPPASFHFYYRTTTHKTPTLNYNYGFTSVYLFSYHLDKC